MQLLTMQSHINRFARLNELLDVHVDFTKEYQLAFSIKELEDKHQVIDTKMFSESFIQTEEVFAYEEDPYRVTVQHKGIVYLFSVYSLSPQELMYEIAVNLSSDDFSEEELETVLNRLEKFYQF